MTVSDTWSDWKTTAALDTPPSTATPEIDKELRNIKAQVKANVVPGRWTADDSGLTALITAIGSDQAEIVFDSALTINPSGAIYSIPANITVKAVKPGIFNVANGKTLVLGTPPAAGLYPIFSCTGTGKVTITYPTEVFPEWFGAAGDGSTDDTTAFNLTFGCFPSDLYGPELGTIRLSQKTYVVDTLADMGYAFRLMGVSKYNSILLSKSGNTVLDIDGSLTHSFELGNFKIVGNGGAGDGLSVTNMTFGYNIHDIYITDVGGRGIYDVGGFSNVYRNIYLDNCGDHAIEGCFVTLDNVYVGNVASGKCGFRIYNSPVMISCNGINSGDYWGIFGYDPAAGDTGYQLTYSNASLINCNIEDFAVTGILCRAGSSPVLRDGTVFLGKDATADLTCVTLQGGSPNTMSFWEGAKFDYKKDHPGGSWKNGLPIHTNGGPPCLFIDLAAVSEYLYYDDTAGAAKPLPRISQAYIAYLLYGITMNGAAIGDFAGGSYSLFDGSGNPSVYAGKGQWTGIRSNTTEVTAMTAGSTTTWSGGIPAGAMVVGVTAYVTQTITGTGGLASFKIGDGSTADKFATGVGLTATSTSDLSKMPAAASPTIYPAATDIVLTANAGSFDGGAGKGKVRLTVHYITLGAPSS